MTPPIELAQALIDFLAFFAPGFVIMLAVEWAVGLFRHDN